jgi:peptidyl-tRNA hydrolase
MERLEPLSVAETLGRIGAMLAAPSPTMNESGRSVPAFPTDFRRCTEEK